MALVKMFLSLKKIYTTIITTITKFKRSEDIEQNLQVLSSDFGVWSIPTIFFLFHQNANLCVSVVWVLLLI